MTIKQKQAANKVSKTKIEQKQCTAKEFTLLFSFKHISNKDDYNFRFFEKNKKNSEIVNAIIAFTEKIRVLSNDTWEVLNNLKRESGIEYIPVSEFKEYFINSLNIPLTDDDKLISVRFNGQNIRFIMRRGTKCSRVAHILGIDYDMKLYKH